MSSEQLSAGGVWAAPLLILHQGSVTPVIVVRRDPPAAGDQGMLQQARRWGYLVPTSGTMSWRPPSGVVVAQMVLVPSGRLTITSDRDVIFDDVVDLLAAEALDPSWQQAAGRAQRVLLYLAVAGFPIVTKRQLQQAASADCVVGGWSSISAPDSSPLLRRRRRRRG